jgi:hypothetical protein
MAGHLTELLEQAREHHRSGRMDCAAPCYQQILRSEPIQLDALIGLADALEALSRNSEMISMMRR